jgi:hypothetical protein
MNSEIWQRLLLLESRDAVDRTYLKIHGRQLNARRSKEVSAAARQAREFFRNAASADFSVKPLLTFYGVASLSRSLTLILRTEGGEEGLSRGHGLETVGWPKTLSGQVSTSLAALGDLRVRTCDGLFTDLVRQTRNRLCFHVRSSAVDWRVEYDIPPAGIEVRLLDLLERLPDLHMDASALGMTKRCADVHDMTFSPEDGVWAKLVAEDFEPFREGYEQAGYHVSIADKTAELTGSAELFAKEFPQFIHAYVQKTFGSIPRLLIAERFIDKACYSQLGVTYLMSYFLGMLCRYFPTHWISLIQGEKGDAHWPILNRAQYYVEQAYPELVIELLQDIMEQGLTSR